MFITNLTPEKYQSRGVRTVRCIRVPDLSGENGETYQLGQEYTCLSLKPFSDDWFVVLIDYFNGKMDGFTFTKAELDRHFKKIEVQLPPWLP